MSLHDRLLKRAARAGVTLPPAAAARLEAYFELLKKWNQKVSLTALPVATDGEEAIDRLLIEPLVATKFLPKGLSTILDVGSGGGSPALPLKIMTPTVPMVMIESRTRKSAFLREAARQLELEQTTVETARLEDLMSQPRFQQVADVVTLRAVRLDAKLVAGIDAFLRSGGRIFAFVTGEAITGRQSLDGRFNEESRRPLLPHLNSWLTVLRKNG